MQETPRSTSRIHHFASLSSSTGARIAPSRTPSRAASTPSRQPPTPSTIRKHERRPSMSQASIPISAFISPHAPSISRSTKFHMRDPRRPPKRPDDTPWGLRFATEDEPGSPIQAWCFFFGFLLFPIWWIAALFLRVPTTRIAGDVDAEKGVAIDDPQIEHGKPRIFLRPTALVSDLFHDRRKDMALPMPCDDSRVIFYIHSVYRPGRHFRAKLTSRCLVLVDPSSVTFLHCNNGHERALRCLNSWSFW